MNQGEEATSFTCKVKVKVKVTYITIGILVRGGKTLLHGQLLVHVACACGRGKHIIKVSSYPREPLVKINNIIGWIFATIVELQLCLRVIYSLCSSGSLVIRLL
jgi:hypothetical protein